MTSHNVLDLAEAADGYRAACAASAANRQARIGQTYELATISPATTLFLQEAVAKFPILDAAEIAILNSSADGGLPHTRPRALICLPASGIPPSLTPEFQETLLHEGVHIHQRLHPPLWSQAVRRAGWRPVPREQIPPEFAERLRINPDTMAEPFWAWDDYHVPLPLFAPHGRGPLSSASTQWLDLRSATLFHEPPASFLKKNKETGAAREHPYELYAYRFSKQGLKTPEEIQTALSSL